MDLAKYAAVMTAPTGSLWFLAHNYLFDPVMPFRIEEARSGKNAATRTVGGNNRLLTLAANTEYQRDANLTFKDGSVSVKWWVLSAEGENSRDRITQYTLASKPIVITYNGQKQGDFPNTVIKDDRVSISVRPTLVYQRSSNTLGKILRFWKGLAMTKKRAVGSAVRWLAWCARVRVCAR